MHRHIYLGLPLAAALASTATAQQPSSSATVDTRDRVVITGEIPVPNVGKGAPYHSVDELKSIESDALTEVSDAIGGMRKIQTSRTDTPHCADPFAASAMTGGGQFRATGRPPGRPPALMSLYDDSKTAASRIAALAGKATEATAKADKSRRDAAAGKVDTKTVERIELERQDAVAKLEKARKRLVELQGNIADLGDMMQKRRPDIDWGELDRRMLERRKAGWNADDLKLKPIERLELTNVRTLPIDDAKGGFLRLQLVVHNASTKTETLPDFVITSRDARGQLLATTVAHSNPTRLDPGANVPLQYDLRTPAHADRVELSLAYDFDPPPELPIGLLCQPPNR